MKNECWEWHGARTTYGYGQKWDGEKVRYTHRLAYEWAFGKIPKGQLVLHHCDNPPCVNPDHLFLGTHKTNAKDKVNKHRHQNQKKTHCKNGHLLSGYNLMVKKSQNGYIGRRCRTCAYADNERYEKRKKALQSQSQT